jgi:hypothetical protein
MSVYTQLEANQVKSDVRMCFAVGAEEAILTIPNGLSHIHPSKHEQLSTMMSSMPGLRCRSGHSCFNIYPTTESTLEINNFLWRTVQNGYYDAEMGNSIFGSNVFVLGLPAELYDFLIHVTLPALDIAIIDFLVLLHHQLTTDGDAVGVEKLREELLPEVWERVERNIGVFDNGEPKEAERAATLEHLVQISFMTPWRVDVMAGFLNPQDMSTLLSHGPHAASERLPSFGPDSVGVRGSALLKMYRDWLVYDDLLCQRLSMKRNAALEAMDRAVYCGRSNQMYLQAAAVVDLCEDLSSWFSRLPIELVERAVVPWVVRRNCESIAPRKRQLATLKSLLEMSSKFFEEAVDENDDEMDEMHLGEDMQYDDDPMHQAYELSALQIEGDEHITTPEDWYVLSRETSIGQAASPKGSQDTLASFQVDDVEEGDFPLDADPPRYSRMERHGGIIDLSVMPSSGHQEAQGGTTGNGDAAVDTIELNVIDSVMGIEVYAPQDYHVSPLLVENQIILESQSEYGSSTA